MCWFSVTLTRLSVFFCLQCAGQASTNPRSEIWSVQSVRLTVSLTMRGRCTVAVRKTTSVLRETPPPWPVPVSVLWYFSLLNIWGYLIDHMRSRQRPDVLQVPFCSSHSYSCYFSISYLIREALQCVVGGYFSLGHKTCNVACLNLALNRCWNPLVWLSVSFNVLMVYMLSHWIIFAEYYVRPCKILYNTMLCLCTTQKAIQQKKRCEGTL